MAEALNPYQQADIDLRDRQLGIDERRLGQQNTFGNWQAGIQALQSAWGAWQSYQGLNLQKKMFAAEQESNRINLQRAATAFNFNMENRVRGSQGFRGLTDSQVAADIKRFSV
jgi:hypothetical protein